MATVYHEGLYFYLHRRAPHPNLVPDFFAGLLDFWLRIETAGQHEFELRVDDRVYLWIDGWQQTEAEPNELQDDAPVPNRPPTGAGVLRVVG